MTAPIRAKLPARRPSLVEKILLGDRKFHVGFGLDLAARQVRDIWIDGPKAGSQEQAALHDASAVVSVALQHGVSAMALAAAVDAPEGAPVSILGAALRRAAEIDEDMREQG